MKKYTVITRTEDGVKFTHVVQACGQTFNEAIQTYGIYTYAYAFEGWITPVDPNNRATWTLPNSCS